MTHKKQISVYVQLYKYIYIYIIYHKSPFFFNALSACLPAKHRNKHFLAR